MYFKGCFGNFTLYILEQTKLGSSMNFEASLEQFLVPQMIL